MPAKIIPKINPDKYYLMFNGIHRYKGGKGPKFIRPLQRLIISFDKLDKLNTFKYFVGNENNTHDIDLITNNDFYINPFSSKPQKKILPGKDIVTIGSFPINFTKIFFYREKSKVKYNLPGMDLTHLFNEIQYFEDYWIEEGRKKKDFDLDILKQMFQNVALRENSGIIATTPIFPNKDGTYFTTVNGRKINDIEWVIEKIQMGGFWNTGIFGKTGNINQEIELEYGEYEYELKLNHHPINIDTYSHEELELKVSSSISNPEGPFYLTPKQTMSYVGSDEYGRQIHLLSKNNDLTNSLVKRMSEPFTEEEKKHLENVPLKDRRTYLHELMHTRKELLNVGQGLVLVNYISDPIDIHDKTHSLEEKVSNIHSIM